MSTIHDALADAIKENGPDEKMHRKLDPVEGMSGDNQALFKALTHFMSTELDQKVTKINHAMGTMASATDKGFAELKKEIDVEKKARKAADAEMEAKMKQLKEETSAIGKGIDMSSASNGWKGKGKGFGKTPRVEPGEWKAFVQGFNEDSQAKHIEDALKALEELMKAVGVTDRRACGGRSTQGLISFTDKDSMTKFIADTKKMPNKIKCNHEEVTLTATTYRTKEEKAETKEIRTCAYVLRKAMKFEGLDKNKLDVDFRNKTVLVNNIRVAQFYDEEGKSIKGRVKRDVHTFKIDKAKLTRNSKDISHPVDADKVQEEYDTAMRS
jgi:hypothetical protein